MPCNCCAERSRLDQRCAFREDHAATDWRLEAAPTAKGYLCFESFSHSGIVNQLESEVLRGN